MYKKITLISLALFALFTASVSAQTSSSSASSTTVNQPVLVATVNITNATATSTDGRIFAISFDISNRVGVQPNVKYAVQLVKTDGSFVDEYVYPNTLSLGENVLEHQTIKYTVPQSVGAGFYHMYLLSENASGLMLAPADLGKVLISKNLLRTITLLGDSCILSVASSTGSVIYKTSALINQGDTVSLSCTVVSTLINATSVTPSFSTTKGDIFGTLVASTTNPIENSVEVPVGTSTVKFNIPLAMIPQHYTVALSLVSSDLNFTSNQINIPYTIAGQSAFIQNVLFDKDFYVAGDIATLRLLAFAPVATSSVSISVTDPTGILCGSSSNILIPNNAINFDAQVPITENCANPIANVSLSGMNASGTNILLDTQSFSVKSATSSLIRMQAGNISSNIALIIALGIILIILFIFFIRRRMTHLFLKNSTVVIVLCIVSATSFFLFSPKAKADTYSWGPSYTHQGDPGEHANFNGQVTFSEPVSPGQNLLVSGATWANNSNSSVWPVISTMRVTLDTSNTWTGGVNQTASSPTLSVACGGSNCSHNGQVTYPAISAGSHYLYVTIAGVPCDQNYGDSCYEYGDNNISSFSDSVGLSRAIIMHATIPFTAYFANIASDSGLSPNTPVDKALIGWSSAGVDSGTITVNGASTPWVAPHYDTVPVTTVTPATYSCETPTGQLCSLLTATTTNTVNTQVYVPETFGSSTISTLLATGTNNLVFQGYVSNANNPNYQNTLSLTACANEGGTCTFSGTQTIMYLYQGVATAGWFAMNETFGYGFKTATNSIGCSQGNFNLPSESQPLGYTFKPTGTCYTINRSTPSVGYISPTSIPQTFTLALCSSEGSQCNFTGTQSVFFGANGVYKFGTYTGGVGCNTNTFGDPLVGTSKACYTMVPYTSASPVVQASVTVYSTDHSPTAWISGYPNPVAPGGTSTAQITWGSTNAQACTVDEGTNLSWQTSIAGTSTSDAGVLPTTFTITCKGLNDATFSTSTYVGTQPLTPQQPVGGNQQISIAGICIASQGTSTNVIVNKGMTWSLTLPSNVPQLSGITTTWGGDNLTNTKLTTSGLTLTNIYTTVGTKMFGATTTGIDVSGNTYTISCATSTKVILGSQSVNQL